MSTPHPSPVKPHLWRQNLDIGGFLFSQVIPRWRLRITLTRTENRWAYSQGFSDDLWCSCLKFVSLSQDDDMGNQKRRKQPHWSQKPLQTLVPLNHFSTLHSSTTNLTQKNEGWSCAQLSGADGLAHSSLLVTNWPASQTSNCLTVAFVNWHPGLKSHFTAGARETGRENQFE